MGNHANVDETIVLDFSMFRRSLVRHLSRDGEFCEQDAALVQQFDAPRQEHARVTRLRNALETIIRTGRSRYGQGVAKEAGIAFVAAGEQVTNVVQLPLETKTRPMDGTPPDAA